MSVSIKDDSYVKVVDHAFNQKEKGTGTEESPSKLYPFMPSKSESVKHVSILKYLLLYILKHNVPVFVTNCCQVFRYCESE